MKRRDASGDESLALPGFSKLVKRRRRKDAPVVTWLTPFHDAYEAAYGVKPEPAAMGRMARALKRGVEAHGADLVARAFRAYLAETPVRFYSIERFAEHPPAAWLGRGDAPAPASSDPLPGEDVDAYIARQSRAR